MSKENRSPIETKDYWTFITLEVCGHRPTAVVPEKNDNGRICQLVYHFGEEALGDYNAWTLGEVREPFETLRKVQQSQTRFKGHLHRYF